MRSAENIQPVHLFHTGRRAADEQPVVGHQFRIDLLPLFWAELLGIIEHRVREIHRQNHRSRQHRPR